VVAVDKQAGLKSSTQFVCMCVLVGALREGGVVNRNRKLAVDNLFLFLPPWWSMSGTAK